MADDNLKEILGFDPDEENRTRPLPDEAPPEVQQAFLDFCERIGERIKTRRKEKIIRQKLLSIEYNGAVARAYYALASPGEVYDFRPTAEACFYPDNAVELAWLGEEDSISGISRLGTDGLSFFLTE